MTLDIGFGMVQESGETFFRYVDDEDWQAGEDFTNLLQRLRQQHGTINVTVSEGYMNERFRYTIFEMPWEPADMEGTNV